MISLAVAFFEIYKKPSESSFMLKRSSSGAILGTPGPLSLKKPEGRPRRPKIWERDGTGTH